ncbi:MAG: glycosyltransferase [Candidatus Krumholzibacteria bacterium]|nr:glycosyltransferase [Candidatus Krumholzibacteria bacterium]
MNYYPAMKILHVGKYYPPYRGGMETALQNLAEGLLDAGCEVSLLTAGHQSVDSQETIQGPRSGHQGKLVRASVCGVFSSQPLTPGLVGLLRREVALFKPDVVHLHLPNPLAAAAWLGLVSTGLPDRPPMVAWYHADITRQKMGRRLLQPLISACLRQAAGICVSSQSLADRSPVLQPHREKVSVIPFGIESQPWLDVQSSCEGAFLFVGRLVPYKGVSVLFEALAAVPAATLTVVGEGPEKEALLVLGKRLGILDRVQFAGTLDEAAIAEYLATARALVLPSIDASEAFGLVQLEAMAAGVPVIATDLPTGVPEVGVPDETGLLVAPGDVGELAAALVRVQNDPQWARSLGQAGRKRFGERYSRERMTERLLAWYQGVVSGRPVTEGKR